MKDKFCKVWMIPNMNYFSDALFKKIDWTYHDCFHLEELRNWRSHSTASAVQTDTQYFIRLLSYSRAVTEGCYVPFSLN